MLRTLLAVSCLVLAAACSEPADRAVGMVVRGDDGVEIGRVSAVERDGEGRIVSAEIAGLEPADAPLPAEELLAEDPNFWVRTSASSGGAFSASR